MIDSNNKLHSLSKSLREAAEQMLVGEAKKNKHGHDAVGHEDDDINNDGKVNQTDEYLAGRRKAIKLTKGWGDGGRSMKSSYGKTMSEGTEDLIELSRKTLGDYIKRAVPDAEKRKEDAVALSKLGHDMKKLDGNHEMGDRMHARAGQEIGKAVNRRIGINRATDRLVKEDVEQIDELSNDTMQAYRKKAKEDPAFEKRKGKVSAVRKAIQAKRTKGMETATKKINARSESEWNEHSKVRDAVTHHMRTEGAAKILGKHGFKKAAENDKRAVFTKADNNSAVVHHVTVIKPGNPRSSDHHVSSYASTTGWQSSDDRHYTDRTFPRTYHKMADLESHKADAEHEYNNHIKGQLDYHNKKGLEEAAQVADGEMLDELSNDTLKGYMGKTKTKSGDTVANTNDPKSMKKYTNRIVGRVRASKRILNREEAEHIDELSRKTVGNYMKKAEADLETSRKLVAQSAKRHGVDTETEYNAPRTQGQFKRQMKRYSGLDNADYKMNPKGRQTSVKVPATESYEEIEEAKRGRPRKNPLPAAQKANSDEPEARQHIMQQLQRAKLSMHGGEHITFKDGSRHFVAGDHAHKLLAKYSDMKPYEKEAFQKKIGGSHTDLKSEI